MIMIMAMMITARYWSKIAILSYRTAIDGCRGTPLEFRNNIAYAMARMVYIHHSVDAGH